MKYTVILAALFLAGCGGVSPIDIQTACIPIKTWSQDQQKALAAALAPIPEASPIWDMAKDWEAMRDAVRACQKG